MRLSLLLSWTICVLAMGTPAATASRSISQIVETRITGILDAFQGGQAVSRVTSAAQELFDQTLATRRQHGERLLVQATQLVRLVRLLSKVEAPHQSDLLEFLRQSPNLARQIAFLVRFDLEHPAEICRVLVRLREAEGAQLERYANLAAAIAVVHDRKLERRINENRTESPDPIDIFRFFRANERQLIFGLRNIPAEVLIYVVDTTASIPEMQWALDRYAGDHDIGSRFFDVKYDQHHYQTGTAKDVTRAGYSLPNIQRWGGVCADQAYFAMSVGKSIGVPTAYAVGRSGSMSHAWVGYLQAKGNAASWNFNTGRYEAYQSVRGIVKEPQVRLDIPDSYVSMMAELIGSRFEDRQAAVACTDAAARLAQIHREALHIAPLSLVATDGQDAPPILETDVASQLTLLDHGLRYFPGHAPAWFALRTLAMDGLLTLEQRHHWADLLQKLCGRKYPDFALAILTPMVTTITDVGEQDLLWERVFAMFPHRPDLAAAVRMSQGQMWEKEGDKERAGRCYEDVINRFANNGPFVIEALEKTAAMLRDLGHQEKVPQLYAHAWEHLHLPTDAHPAFRKQSNWFKVGTILTDHLQAIGKTKKAESIRARIIRNMNAAVTH